MKYVGGKSRIARRISEAILSRETNLEHYIEPFIGGGSVMPFMVPHFEKSLLTDHNENVVILFQELLDGWKPPVEVSEELYQSLRHAEPSALRSFVGYGCSFGGKWFGGYARGGDRNFAAETARNLDKIMANILPYKGDVVFRQEDYVRINFSSDLKPVIYCDPPYADSQGYGNEVFDSQAFWDCMDEWVERGARVYVSEHKAPEHWHSIWSSGVTTHLVGGATSRPKRVEHLFVHESQL